MTVSDVGRMAIFFSKGVSPLFWISVVTYEALMRGTYACVTQATSAAKPSIWSFSFSSTSWETNSGKEQFLTPIFLIRTLNHSCMLSQMKYEAGYMESATSKLERSGPHLQDIAARNVIVVEHIALGQDLRVPVRKVILLCNIDSNESCPLDLLFGSFV